MDADERVTIWSTEQVRDRLGYPPIGSHEGTRNNHYRYCSDLAVEVLSTHEEWYSEHTYDGWKVRVRVTCLHGEVVTSHGVTPLTPVEIVLDFDGDIQALDAQDGHPASNS